MISLTLLLFFALLSLIKYLKYKTNGTKPVTPMIKDDEYIFTFESKVSYSKVYEVKVVANSPEKAVEDLLNNTNVNKKVISEVSFESQLPLTNNFNLGTKWKLLICKSVLGKLTKLDERRIKGR